MARLRFDPPQVPATPALRWVLARAFAPVGAGVSAPGAGALALASRLSLAARIATRVPAERLAAEVAGEAEGFRQERAAVVASDLARERLIADLAARAAALALPLVPLKSTALKLGGWTAAGSRGAADLDVLLPEEGWRPFHAALVASGFEPSPEPEMEHQLPALRAPAGGVVEIHRVLLGVRLSGRRSAGFADLAVAGRLLAAPGFPASVFLPDRAVLTAHAVVHGLVQHGWAPHAYPAPRLLADLADLGLGSEEGGLGSEEGRLGGEGGELVAAVAPLVATLLDGEDLAALCALVRALEAGDPRFLDLPPRADPAAALLHHLLAGVLDPDYGPALRFAMLARPLSDRSPAGRLLAALRGALWPSRAELDALHGGPAGRWRSLGRRLGRPFALLRRAVRYHRSRAELRRRADSD